jgi:8-hydroxy-5-deazaflavin:NADPH oxidoreductase
MARTAFLGGTGPEGLGLAVRFALAGEEVIIGSRQTERAEQAAERLRLHLGRRVPAARVCGVDNAAAARAAEVIVVALPFTGVEPLLTAVAPALSGKIVLDVVNPLQRTRGVFRMQPVADGSAGELIQRLLPRSPVVSCFKNLSAEELWDTEQTLHGDVLLCGDHPEASRYCIDLVRRMPALRAVDAGGLGNAAALESITALLLNLNRRYRAITSVEILGLALAPDGGPQAAPR